MPICRNGRVNEVCNLALFRELSKDKGQKEALLSIEKDLLKQCVGKDRIFAFFHRLPPEILSLYQLDDKTCVDITEIPRAR